MREHFASYRKQTGRRHKEDVDVDPPPSTTMYLFKWFQEIARGRPIAGTGHYLPLPASELLAWSTLKRVMLEEWEIEAIRLLDNAFLKVMAEKDD